MTSKHSIDLVVGCRRPTQRWRGRTSSRSAFVVAQPGHHAVDGAARAFGVSQSSPPALWPSNASRLPVRDQVCENERHFGGPERVGSSDAQPARCRDWNRGDLDPLPVAREAVVCGGWNPHRPAGGDVEESRGAADRDDGRWRPEHLSEICPPVALLPQRHQFGHGPIVPTGWDTSRVFVSARQTPAVMTLAEHCWK